MAPGVIHRALVSDNTLISCSGNFFDLFSTGLAHAVKTMP
jgi:hypothetical protein